MAAKAGAVDAGQALAGGGGGSRLPLFLWAVGGFAICAAMAPLEPSILEEGIVLHITQRMVGGERLYSELASFTGPLPFHLLALLFRLFGEEIAVARTAVAVLAGLSTASVYGIARQSGAGPLAHAAAAAIASSPVLLFPLHSTYFYSTIAYHVVLIAAYAALRGTHSSGWAIAAGVLTAGAALCKQSVGIPIALGLMAAIFACARPGRRMHATLAMVLGGAAVTAATLVYYTAHGELEVFVQSLVVVPLGFGVAFDSPFINLWPLGELSPEVLGKAHFYTPFVYGALREAVLDPASSQMIFATQLLYALPLVALAATLLRRLMGPLSPGVWIHAAALLALTSNLFPRTDWGHLVFAVAPAAAQLLLLAPQQCPRSSRAREGFAGLLVTGFVCASLYIGSSLWAHSAESNLGPHIPLRSVSSLHKQPALARVIEHLDRRMRPGEAIFVARAEPLVYFASKARNPTPYSGVIPGIFQQQEESIVAGLEQVRFVVMSEIDQPVFTYYRDLLPRVEAYFERHFRVHEEFLGDGYGWIIVLERDRDRGPTAIDLFDLRDRAQAWWRDAQGAIYRADEELPRLATSHNRRPMPVWLGPGGGGIDFEIDVPTDAIFEADIGLGEIYAAPLTHARRVTFAVSLARAEDFESLLSIPALSDPSDGADWRPIEVDLSAYAGERVTLSLEVTPKDPTTAARIAWWGSPRLVVRSGASVAGERESKATSVQP